MDRKSILVLVVCFLLLMLWMPLVNLIYPPVPAPATNIVGKATSPTAGSTNIAATSSPAATPPSITSPTARPTTWGKPEVPEELVAIENQECRYTLSSHWGGLRQIELKAYPESVRRTDKKKAGTGRLATLNLGAPLPVMALLGGGALDDSRPFKVSRTDNALQAEKQLSNGLWVVKEFILRTNYMVSAVVRIQNRSSEAAALPAHELVIGSATPINRHDDGMLLGVQVYDGSRAQFVDRAWFDNRTLGCFPGTPRSEYHSSEFTNVVWGAVHNQFFAIIAVPQLGAPHLAAHRFDLPRPTREELAVDSRLVKEPFGFQSALAYPGQIIAPGREVAHAIDLYAGPKRHDTLVALGKNLELAMNFSAFFGWFAKALLLSMNGLHKFGLSYGLAIIAITIIIKLLFWPLTAASTKSMKRMAALQPQMKAIQEKYKDDPKKMQAKLMEFMKEHKVSPLGGCVPILLQIPVFIGFYQMLRSAIELRGASFLWASDLSQPDTVLMVLGFPVNPLPLIMGATQIWQTRLTPPSPGMDPVQQKMMQYMPLFFIFLLYNFPAGLALYWTVQNLLSILQMKLTKAGADKQDAKPAGGHPLSFGKKKSNPAR